MAEPAKQLLDLSKKQVPQKTMYKTKQIQFFGRKTPIILQNENGPCPLIAICNILLLREKLGLRADVTQVSQKKLISLLAEHLFRSIMKVDDPQIIVEASELVSRLAMGIAVNLKFTRIDDFEYTKTRECLIFDLLDIPLYHGWIVDPQDSETLNAIGSKSYDTLMEDLLDLQILHMQDLSIKNAEEARIKRLIKEGIGKEHEPSIGLKVTKTVDPTIAKSDGVNTSSRIRYPGDWATFETGPREDVCSSSEANKASHDGRMNSSELEKHESEEEIEKASIYVVKKTEKADGDSSSSRISYRDDRLTFETDHYKASHDEQMNTGELEKRESTEGIEKASIYVVKKTEKSDGDSSSSRIGYRDDCASFETDPYKASHDEQMNTSEPEKCESNEGIEKPSIYAVKKTEKSDGDSSSSRISYHDDCVTFITDPNKASHDGQKNSSELEKHESKEGTEKASIYVVKKTEKSDGNPSSSRISYHDDCATLETDADKAYHDDQMNTSEPEKGESKDETEKDIIDVVTKTEKAGGDYSSTRIRHHGEWVAYGEAPCSSAPNVAPESSIKVTEIKSSSSTSKSYGSEGKVAITAIQGELIRNFLDNNASQLTVYGLFCLQEGLKEGELCVFFRNNHFNTMFKYRGELYILVTDQGYMHESGVVWEKLNEVNGDTVFVNRNFKLFKLSDHEIQECTSDEETVLAKNLDYLNRVDKTTAQRTTTLSSDLQFAKALQQQESHQEQASKKKQLQHAKALQQLQSNEKQSALIVGPKHNNSTRPRKISKKLKDKCSSM